MQTHCGWLLRCLPVVQVMPKTTRQPLNVVIGHYATAEEAAAARDKLAIAVRSKPVLNYPPNMFHLSEVLEVVNAVTAAEPQVEKPSVEDITNKAAALGVQVCIDDQD